MSDETAKVYLVEITAYDDDLAGTRVLRFCTGAGKITEPSETPANTWYEPAVIEPANFSRYAFADARVTGPGSVGFGEIVLNNADQGLNFLLDLGIDGRDVVVRVGPQDGDYPGDYTTFLTATAEQPEVTATRATIRLRDKQAILQLPLQATKFAGTNSLPAGAEGTADDLKGQPKPLGFGEITQAEPPCVNTSKLIFQGHDGTVQSIDAVYDAGAVLAFGTNRADLAAMEATAPSAGNYDTCTSLGLIRLGASPAGRVTMDFKGDATGGYVDTAAGIVERILTQRCGVSGGDIDSSAFTALASAASANVGVFVREETARLDVIGTVLESVGAWLSLDRDGQWTVGQLIAPSGTPAVTFTEDDIFSIDRQATNDPEQGVPVYRVTLNYLRYWSPQSLSESASSLTDARRAQLAQAWRTTSATDAGVQTKHLLAPEMVRDTLLTDATEAATEAARRLALHKVRRDFVQAEVAFDATNAALDIGAVVELVTPRLGYDAGRLFYVVGITSTGRTNRMTLDLWG